MTHRRHAMDNDQYWDHRPGDPVMTVDGYPGTVTEVSDGPVPGNENYRVELHNGMGGGDYSSGQLSALTHSRTASGHEAAGLHVASEDYPELGEILYERPDPGKLTFAAAQQAAEAPEEGAQLRDTDQPDSCSYCGSRDFTGQTDNGRVKQATCATCGGTMSAHPGAQWTPELIGDPSNHPSTTVDPASGASGAGGQAGVNDLIDFDSRVSTAAALHTAGQSFERDWHQHGDVSDDEYSALSNYSGNGVNEDLNPYLRGHQMPYTDAHDADAMNDIHQTRHHMDNLADRFSTRHPMTVYRTAPYGDVREGQELHDPGYMSTTEHQSVAKGYADRDHSLMKIHVPAGTQAIPMHHLVNYTGARGEVVLPRGSRVRVNQIHDDHIEGELLPHSGRKTAGAKEAALAGHDWCTWRREARCTFPGDSTAVSLAIPQDRGPCPWETPWQQQVCPISEPGPMALMHAKGSLTAEGAIPPGPCAECGAEGHYDIEEENPDYHGDDENDPDAYRMRRETCEMCGGSGTDSGMSDEELEQQRKDREQAKVDDQQWHRENVPHPDGVRTWRCGPHSACTFPVRPPEHPESDAAEHPAPGRKERVEKAMKQRADQLARTQQSTATMHRIAGQMRTALGTED